MVHNFMAWKTICVHKGERPDTRTAGLTMLEGPMARPYNRWCAVRSSELNLLHKHSNTISPMNNNMVCTVCLETIMSNGIVTVCGHSFHKDCCIQVILNQLPEL